ncbi:MAG: hypothetical protein FJ096_22005, partial [Deltaproteobacteria bacterium]|nr:hypothetical protein [Deltaproteobacteria bacterium]
MKLGARSVLLLATLSGCVADVDSLTDEDVLENDEVESVEAIGTVEDPIIGGTVDKTTRSVVAVV